MIIFVQFLPILLPHSTLLPDHLFIYQHLEKVGRKFVIFLAKIDYLAHFLVVPARELTSYLRNVGVLKDKVISSPKIIHLLLVVVVHLIICNGGYLAKALVPQKQCDDLLLAHVALFLCLCHQFPLGRTRHQFFQPQMPLYDQLGLLHACTCTHSIHSLGLIDFLDLDAFTPHLPLLLIFFLLEFIVTLQQADAKLCHQRLLLLTRVLCP